MENLYIELGIENFIEAISNNVDMTDVLSKEHSTNYHILYYRQLNKLLSIIDIDNKNYKKIKNLSDVKTLIDYKLINHELPKVIIYNNNFFIRNCSRRVGGKYPL